MRKLALKLLSLIFALALASCSVASQKVVATPKPERYYTTLWFFKDLDPTYYRLRSERPTYKGELNLEDLHSNKFVTRFYGKDHFDTVLLLTNPYYSGGECRINSIIWKEDWPHGKFYEEGWCADFGVVAYNSDSLHLHGWNTAYAMPSYQKPLTDEQFSALRLFLVPSH